MAKDGGKVLVIDDDPDLVVAIAAVLEHAGMETETRQVRSVDDVAACAPDVVYVDCPPGHTREIINFVQLLRLDGRTARTPVLISVSSRRYLEPALLRAQLIHVIVKPYAAEDLVLGVRELWQARRNLMSS